MGRRRRRCPSGRRLDSVAPGPRRCPGARPRSRSARLGHRVHPCVDAWGRPATPSVGFVGGGGRDRHPGGKASDVPLRSRERTGLAQAVRRGGLPLRAATDGAGRAARRGRRARRGAVPLRPGRDGRGARPGRSRCRCDRPRPARAAARRAGGPRGRRRRPSVRRRRAGCRPRSRQARAPVPTSTATGRAPTSTAITGTTATRCRQESFPPTTDSPASSLVVRQRSPTRQPGVNPAAVLRSRLTSVDDAPG